MASPLINSDFEEVSFSGTPVNDDFEEISFSASIPQEGDFEEAKEFLPLEELTTQIDKGEFDPLRYAASLQARGVNLSSLPEDQQKRIRDSYVYARSKGVTAEGVKRGVKGIPASLFELGKGLVQAGITTGKGAKALVSGEKQQALKKLSEIGAATEAAGLETVEFARRAGRKFLRGPSFPGETRLDPSKREALEKDFNLDLEVATQIAKAEQGQGAFAELRELDVESLRKEGIELDIDAIRSMSLALDPLNFVPAAGGFQIVSKSGKIIGFAKTAQAAQKAIEQVEKVVTKGAAAIPRVVGRAIETTARGMRATTRGAAPSLLATAAAIAAGRPEPLLGALAAPLVRTGADLIEKSGKAITRTAPLVEKATEFVVTHGARPAVEGAIVGGIASLPLAALTDTDAEAEGIISYGAAGGALLGPLEAAGRRIGDPFTVTANKLSQRYQAITREPTTSAPYGDTPFDASHTAQMESLARQDPAGANVINTVREFLRPENKRMFLIGDEGFERLTGSRTAAGWIDPTRTTIVLRRGAGADAVFHEPGHALQWLMKEKSPELYQSWLETLKGTFPEEKLARFKNTYEELLNKGLPPEQRRTLSENEIVEELGAEAISNALRGHPLNGLPLPFRQKAIGIAGGLMESLGLYTPEITGPRPGTLGVEPSFRLSNFVNKFLEDEGLLGQPPVAPVQPEITPAQEMARAPIQPAAPPAPVQPAPKGKAPVLDFEPVDAAGWNNAEQRLVETGAPQADIQTFRKLRDETNKPQGAVGPVEVQYESVTPEGTRPVERIFRRQKQAEAYELERNHLLGLLSELPPDLRTVFSKTFIPNRVLLRAREDGSLNVNVLGTSPDKILANAILAGRIAKEKGISLPVNVDKNGLLTTAGVESLHDALVKYTQNQSNGYAGDGSRLERPEGYEAQIPAENPNYTPQPLNQRMAQFVNMLIGIEPPRTSKLGSTPRFSATGQRITIPANLEARRLAEATIARAQAERRASMAEIRPAQLAKPGKEKFKTGETIAEFNPLRDEFTQKDVELDNILSEGVEELSLEHFKGVEGVESRLRGVATPVVTAGFMPFFDPMNLARKVDEATDMSKVFPNPRYGFTDGAIDTGLALTKREDLDILQELQKKWNQESKNLIKEGRLSEAMQSAIKGQFFREAYEAATGTGSMGERLKRQKREALSPFRNIIAGAFLPNLDPDAIKEAAVRYEPTGEIFTGKAHFEALNNAERAGLNYWELPDKDFVYGFVSNEGEFLTRDNAFLRAKSLNQLPSSADFEKSFGLEAEQFQDIRTDIQQGRFMPALSEEPAQKILDEIKTGAREGVTLNRDGTEFSPGDRKLDVVTVASVDIPVEELSADRMREALNQYAKILSKPDVKPGIFRIARKGPNGEALVSLDVNAVVDQKHRENTIKFASDNNQESFFDLVSFETVPTGGDGRTVLTQPSEIARAIDSLVRGEPVDVEALRGEAAEEGGEFMPSTELKKFKPTRDRYSKGWILPNGDWVALGGQWHHEWLKENAKELNEQFKTQIGDNPNERLDALNKGFVRVNYDKNGGTFTVEANKKYWTKGIKDSVFELYLDNADDIDNMRVNLLNDEGNLVQDGYSRLHTYPENERIERLPLITEERGAFMPAQSEFNLSDLKRFPEALPLKERAVPSKMEKKELRQLTASVPYNFKTTALAKKVMGKDVGKRDIKAKAKEPKLINAYADKIEQVYNENKDNPEIATALNWYSNTRKLLKDMFKDDRDFFAQLLAATSKQTDVKQNFNYAVELFNRYQLGEFDELIPKFHKVWNEKVATGDYVRDYEKAHGQRSGNDFSMVEEAMENAGVKLRSYSGKRYGLHTIAAMQVLGGMWLRENSGAKVINFYNNLIGTSNAATIDIWASRLLHRLGNEGLVKRWRIRPAAESALNPIKLKFAQDIFDVAAKKLDLEPDALQAFMWFLEKDIWSKRGWDESSGRGAEKPSFEKELSKIRIKRIDNKPIAVDIKSGKRFDIALREAKVKPKSETSERMLFE